MNYTLIVKPEAEIDILEASLWYREQRADLAEDFLEAIEEKIKILLDNPQLFAIRYKEIRQAPLTRFPFAVHYSIEETTIFVLAVLHTRRNPVTWQKRK